MKNIAVLVSGNGTNLQAVIDAIKIKKIKEAKISVVISSNENAFALKRAEKEKIKTVVIKKKDYSSNEEFNQELLKKLKKENLDLIVLAGFLHILSEDFIYYFKNRIINVHPSLIPAFCGKNYYGLKVHEAALKRGVKLTGATVHFVNEITDGGPIILQKSVKVLESDTKETLQERVLKEAEWKILVEAIDLFCSDKITIEKNIVKIEG